MANEVQVGGSKNVNARGLQRWGQSMSGGFSRLDKVDIAAAEGRLGVFLKGKYAAQAISWDNLVLAAYFAQRERLANSEQGTTVAGMLARPDGEELRAILLANWGMNEGLSEVIMRTRLAEGDKALLKFEAFLNEGTALVLKEGYLGQGTPKSIKFRVRAVGMDSESTRGHNQALKDAAAKRIAAVAQATPKG